MMMLQLRSVALSVVAAISWLPAMAYGQTQAGISGTVKDASGGVLPGVTVEVSSPALIEQQRFAVSDGQGVYRFVDLRPGTYTVTFVLPGFSEYRREGITITTGFIATVDGELTVGALEEAVVVTGAAPVVDTQSVLQQHQFSRETVDAVPLGSSTGQYATLLPGAVHMRGATAQDVGGITGEQQASAFSIHGTRAQDSTVAQDGVVLNNLTAGGATNWSFNRALVQEVVVQTSGISAEVMLGGPYLNVVSREGGNTLTGSLDFNGSNSAMQGTNVSDSLRARGVTQAPEVRRLYDASGSLGGPIIRNRVWFYTGHRWWGASQYAPGKYFNSTQDSWLYTPDLTRPAYTDETFRDNSLRLTSQITKNQTLILFANVQKNCTCFQSLLTVDAAPEAVNRLIYEPNYSTGATWRLPASNRLFLEGGFTVNRLVLSRYLQEGVTESDIAVRELSTNFAYRSRADSLNTPGASGARKTYNLAEFASATFVTGSHSFKAGIKVEQSGRDENNIINQGRDYSFRNGLPVSVRLWVQPHRIQSNIAGLGIFAQDQWTIRNLTLNLGVRFDRTTGGWPEQQLPAGEFLPARSFPAASNVMAWNDINARVGGAYDLFGNGKTAVKVFFGRYVAQEGVGGVTSLGNPVNTIVTSATRTWNDNFFGAGDPRSGNFAPDCQLGSPEANGECGRLSPDTFGGTRVATRLADDMLYGFRTRPSNWQAQVSVQHQLAEGFAVDIGYFRTSHNNLTTVRNEAVSPADYDPYCIVTPVDPRLPGGGGQELCGLYDINPAKFGRVDNVLTQVSNFGDRTEVYNGVDVNTRGRLPGGGTFAGGVNIGRTTLDECVVVNSPGDARDGYCRVQPPWSASTQAKFLVVYRLPWGVQLSGTYQNVPGIERFATLAVPNSQIAPSLGRNLSAGAGANVIVPITAPATSYEDRIQQVDLRFGRRFNLKGTTLRLDFDIYNALNASPILSMVTRYGPAWLRANQILQARLFKLGAQFRF